MAVVVGTNAGFVETAPVDDPAGSSEITDNLTRGIADTSPATATTVTEIGWYCQNDTQAANFEVGVYDDSVGDPNNLLSGESRTNAKGTTLGWKPVTGLNITISSSTDYWIAFQLDDTATDTRTDQSFDMGGSFCIEAGATTLTDPYSGTTGGYYFPAIYAVWEAGAAGTNTKVNISDLWKDVSEIKVNIGDTWKDVNKIQVNIGDVWKTVFG